MNVVNKVDMVVRGTLRTVHLARFSNKLDGYPARTYVNSKSVYGLVKENRLGAKRFYPSGKNAALV